MRRHSTLASIALVLLAPVMAQAQGGERNQSLAFYGLAPFIDGDLTFGESGQGDIDVDAGDILDSLEIAETELQRRGPVGTLRRSADESFTDAVIGLRTLRPLGEKMRFQAQGDIGAGDLDFSWQGMLHLGYQASDAISLLLGYRALGLDFEEADGPAGVDVDMVLHGPTVGLAFHF